MSTHCLLMYSLRALTTKLLRSSLVNNVVCRTGSDAVADLGLKLTMGGSSSVLKD